LKTAAEKFIQTQLLGKSTEACRVLKKRCRKWRRAANHQNRPKSEKFNKALALMAANVTVASRSLVAE
jgi:hypothetical protein